MIADNDWRDGFYDDPPVDPPVDPPSRAVLTEEQVYIAQLVLLIDNLTTRCELGEERIAQLEFRVQRLEENRVAFYDPGPSDWEKGIKP